MKNENEDSPNDGTITPELIAAAPELLELCQRTQAYLADPDSSDLDEIGFATDLEFVISKALGR